MTPNIFNPYRYVEGSIAGNTRAVEGGGATLLGGGGQCTLMEYVQIHTLSDGATFGEMTENTGSAVSCGSGSSGTNFRMTGTGNDTRGVFCGGAWTDTMQYITIASTGDSIDFGDLTGNSGWGGACSNNTYGIQWGGYQSTQMQDKYTIATPANATSFGTFPIATYVLTGCASSTRAFSMGGYTGDPYTDDIRYTTFASLGDMVDFGDLISARQSPAGYHSDTRGGTVGGADTSGYTDVMDYFTMADSPTITAGDFGDLTAYVNDHTATSSSTYGVAMQGGQGTAPSGSHPPSTNIDRWQIDTTGNATFFGDMTCTLTQVASCSDYGVAD